MTPEESANLSEGEAEARRQELRSLSSEERVRRARELAEQMRARKRAEAGVAPATPAAVQPAGGQAAEAQPPGEATAAPDPRAAAPRPAGREEKIQEAPIVPPPPGTVADVFHDVLPDVEMTPMQTAYDVAIIVRREDLLRVMKAAKEDDRLAFDYLRCLSGVDHMERGMEVVYHLYSFQHEHSVAIKSMAPSDDLRMPSMVSLWNAADWHERETWELFGITFEGHPDLRVLLTEEGLGYYILRKDFPLAEIEEWQEELLFAPSEAEG